MELPSSASAVAEGMAVDPQIVQDAQGARGGAVSAVNTQNKHWPVDKHMMSCEQVKGSNAIPPNFEARVPRCLMDGCDCLCYEEFMFGDTDDECTCGHPKSKHAF